MVFCHFLNYSDVALFHQSLVVTNGAEMRMLAVELIDTSIFA